MIRINQIKVPLEHTSQDIVRKAAAVLRIAPEEILTWQIVKKSIDARKKPEIWINYALHVSVASQKKVIARCKSKQVQAVEEKNYEFPAAGGRKLLHRPVIIGTGPAGLFCGYMLAKAGFCPILLERGDAVEERTKKVQAFWETGKLDTQSNVQCGFGGAGAFSDGKLNTLVKDKYGRNQKVLSILAKMGASPEILYDHKPHIGTDVLSRVVVNLRNEIISLGGEVRFRAAVTDITYENNQITGVIINDSEHMETPFVVLAPGHSARDTFAMLYDKGVVMEAKPFAVGMRVEHPQELINLSQYGTSTEETLGNAVYKVTAKTGSGKEGYEAADRLSAERGVYSFCMCPGGYVVNASSEPERLAVNGMSYSGRDGDNANSAIIVSVTPEDYGADGLLQDTSADSETNPLAGVEFQRRLEERAFLLGQGDVPVQRYGLYKACVDQGCGQEELAARQGRELESLLQAYRGSLQPCIKGKWRESDLSGLLPAELGRAFVEGMEQFGRQIPGFNRSDAILSGVESRTSSPVRILRDEELQSRIRGIYPCGEGAGYAGGITSAAMDGIRVAEAIASAYRPPEGKNVLHIDDLAD